MPGPGASAGRAAPPTTPTLTLWGAGLFGTIDMDQTSPTPGRSPGHEAAHRVGASASVANEPRFVCYEKTPERGSSQGPGYPTPGGALHQAPL